MEETDGWQTVPSKPRYTESMINTSLPARHAPSLAPATMASLSVPTGQPVPVVHPMPSIPLVKTGYAAPSIPLTPLAPLRKPVVTADDFPTLGGPKKTAVETAPKSAMKWADMSKDWAKKQKEEEEKQKEEKERDRMMLQTQMNAERLKEKEEMEARKRFGIITLPSMMKKSDDEPLPSYHEDRLSDEEYVSDPLDDEEEDDEEITDDDWHSRKHRDELY
jgi:hypothetical protein